MPSTITNCSLCHIYQQCFSVCCARIHLCIQCALNQSIINQESQCIYCMRPIAGAYRLLIEQAQYARQEINNAPYMRGQQQYHSQIYQMNNQRRRTQNNQFQNGYDIQGNYLNNNQSNNNNLMKNKNLNPNLNPQSSIFNQSKIYQQNLNNQSSGLSQSNSYTNLLNQKSQSKNLFTATKNQLQQSSHHQQYYRQNSAIYAQDEEQQFTFANNNPYLVAKNQNNHFGNSQSIQFNQKQGNKFQNFSGHEGYQTSIRRQKDINFFRNQNFNSQKQHSHFNNFSNQNFNQTAQQNYSNNNFMPFNNNNIEQKNITSQLKRQASNNFNSLNTNASSSSNLNKYNLSYQQQCSQTYQNERLSHNNSTSLKFFQNNNQYLPNTSLPNNIPQSNANNQRNKFLMNNNGTQIKQINSNNNRQNCFIVNNNHHNGDTTKMGFNNDRHAKSAVKLRRVNNSFSPAHCDNNENNGNNGTSIINDLNFKYEKNCANKNSRSANLVNHPQQYSSFPVYNQQQKKKQSSDQKDLSPTFGQESNNLVNTVSHNLVTMRTAMQQQTRQVFKLKRSNSQYTLGSSINN